MEIYVLYASSRTKGSGEVGIGNVLAVVNEGRTP